MLELCKKIQYFFLFVIIFSSPVYANFGYDSPYKPKLVAKEKDEMIIEGLNYSINVNKSNYWDNLNNPSDISIGDINLINEGWINESGDTMSGTLNMSGNLLTDVGELIVEGLTTAQNIVPDTDNLYNLGNNTRWWKEVYIKTIHSNNVLTDFLNATNINSTDVNSETVDVEQNITIGGHTVKKEGNNLVVVLNG